MSAAPVITIFVRHSEDCKYAGDEFTKRCNCKKHLRWTLNGKQYRRKTGARSWAAAEEKKRDLEGQLIGRSPVEENGIRSLDDAADLFIKDKRVQGVCADVIR